MQTLSQHDPSLEAVVYSVFQQPNLLTRGHGMAVALVAAHPQAGTTYVTRVLTEALNAEENPRATATKSREFMESASAEQGIAVSLTRGNWQSSRDRRISRLDRLRERYATVLIDCPSLKRSKDILALAPLVDGVLLVVEANKTTKSQVAFLERMIAEAGGRSLGHLLNKRTYPIPAWAYNLLGF